MKKDGGETGFKADPVSLKNTRHKLWQDAGTATIDPIPQLSNLAARPATMRIGNVERSC
jgi:hypothetical protein